MDPRTIYFSVLGAVLGDGGDRESLLRAFITLRERHRLVVVDWRSHMILSGVSPDGAVELWRPDGE